MQLSGHIIPNINHELLRIDEDWFLPNSGLSCSCFAPPSGLQSRRPGTPVTFCSKLVAEHCKVGDAPTALRGWCFTNPKWFKNLKTIDKNAWKHQVIGILAIFANSFDWPLELTEILFLNLKRPWVVNHHRLFLAPSPAFVGVITTSMGSTRTTTHPSPSFPTKTCAAGMWMVGAKIATSTDLGSAPTPLKASLSSGNWLKHLESRSKNIYWDIIRRMVSQEHIISY